jgi:hypothetical protein
MKVIIKKEGPKGRVFYNFLGDCSNGLWVCKQFRVRPLVLLSISETAAFNIVWLYQTEINGKQIYWPYVEESDKQFKLIQYKEK